MRSYIIIIQVKACTYYSVYCILCTLCVCDATSIPPPPPPPPPVVASPPVSPARHATGSSGDEASHVKAILQSVCHSQEIGREAIARLCSHVKADPQEEQVSQRYMYILTSSNTQRTKEKFNLLKVAFTLYMYMYMYKHPGTSDISEFLTKGIVDLMNDALKYMYMYIIIMDIVGATLKSLVSIIF